MHMGKYYAKRVVTFLALFVCSFPERLRRLSCCLHAAVDWFLFFGSLEKKIVVKQFISLGEGNKINKDSFNVFHSTV